MMPKYIVLLFTICCSVYGFSQTEKIEYKYGFDFVEGIYLSYEDFINNDPSIKKKDVLELKPYSKEFKDINKGILGIDFKNKEGVKQHIKATLMWGYCLNNEIYIRFKNGFFKLTKIGAICYFIEDRTFDSYQRSYAANGYVGGESNLYKDRIHVFDIDSGTILPYKPDILEKLIVDDTSLFNEFINLGDKKIKLKFMFKYLEQYNERNPVYFPTSSLKVFDTDQSVEIEFN